MQYVCVDQTTPRSRILQLQCSYWVSSTRRIGRKNCACLRILVDRSVERNRVKLSFFFVSLWSLCWVFVFALLSKTKGSVTNNDMTWHDKRRWKRNNLFHSNVKCQMSNVGGFGSVVTSSPGRTRAGVRGETHLFAPVLHAFQHSLHTHTRKRGKGIRQKPMKIPMPMQFQV